MVRVARSRLHAHVPSSTVDCSVATVMRTVCARALYRVHVACNHKSQNSQKGTTHPRRRTKRERTSLRPRVSVAVPSNLLSVIGYRPPRKPHGVKSEDQESIESDNTLATRCAFLAIPMVDAVGDVVTITDGGLLVGESLTLHGSEELAAQRMRVRPGHQAACWYAAAAFQQPIEDWRMYAVENPTMVKSFVDGFMRAYLPPCGCANPCSRHASMEQRAFVRDRLLSLVGYGDKTGVEDFADLEDIIAEQVLWQRDHRIDLAWQRCEPTATLRIPHPSRRVRGARPPYVQGARRIHRAIRRELLLRGDPWRVGRYTAPCPRARARAQPGPLPMLRRRVDDRISSPDDVAPIQLHVREELVRPLLPPPYPPLPSIACFALNRTPRLCALFERVVARVCDGSQYDGPDEPSPCESCSLCPAGCGESTFQTYTLKGLCMS